MTNIVRSALFLCIAFCFSGFATGNKNEGNDQKTDFELKKGSSIAIIGNTLAERLQEDGWLETYIQYRFPEHELKFRDLGYSADEVNFRQREEAFGTPDEWLNHVAADVIFAFFGFNESFQGQQGLEKFKSELTDFLKHSKAQKYNGKSAPEIVLFSPIAHEDIKSPHLPDGT
jgi:hypothetical protein